MACNSVSRNKAVCVKRSTLLRAVTYASCQNSEALPEARPEGIYQGMCP